MDYMSLLQSAVAHMAVAVRLLDKVGADVSAAQVEAAIQGLRDDEGVQQAIADSVIFDELDFSAMDKLIDEIYVSQDKLIGPN